LSTPNEKIEKLRKAKDEAKLGGGKDAIEKQHKKGKLTARERLKTLLDPSSFIEFDDLVLHQCVDFEMSKKKVLGDGVVTGMGTIDGRLVAVYAQDVTFIGGSAGIEHCKKICRTIEYATKMGIPVIGLNESGGARIQEGIDSLHGIGLIFHENVMASGVVPQIAAIVGPCAGGAVYSPALMDFVFMVKGTSFMFITGPRVVKEVTGEEVSFENLGEVSVHSTINGQAHFTAESDEECLIMIRKLLSYLPSNNLADPPIVNSEDSPDRMDEELNYIVPTDPRKAYSMHEVIKRIIDKDSLLEVHKDYGPNVIVGFAKLNNRTIGVIANQPKVYSGCLDINASDKISRFIRFCDCFNIPLITFQDIPGYLPGVKQEYGGIIRHGAKVIYAYIEAAVPKILIIVRKAYGGGHIAMCSKALGADFVFAWPSAEVAVMGPEGAVQIISRRKIESASNPDEMKRKLTEEYRAKFANPYVGAARGYINTIIEPKETRPQLIRILEILRRKSDRGQPRFRRKHRNMPL